ncbi:MAG TPA: bifunctional diguanylate cyclase/phosphodiesterase [Pyrinomonadaceae bacterium]|nr:bifunctional diguanylate cyclase/phosphodiesterase [Pyrinomonadaceae bacterium]
MTANSLQLPDNPRKTTWTGLTLLAAIYVVAYLSWTFFHWGGETTRQVVNSIALLPLRALTVLLAWQISNQPNFDTRSRRAWRLLAFAFLALFLGDCLRPASGGVIEASFLTFLATALSAAFYLLLLFSLLSFPTILRSRNERERFWLDLGIVMISGGIAIWYFLVHPAPIEINNGLLPTAASLIKPTGDLAILFGSASVLLATPEEKNRLPFGFLILGLLLFFAADLTYGHVSLYDKQHSSFLVDTLWAMSTLVLFVSCQLARRTLSDPSKPQPVTIVGNFRLLPYLSIGFVYGLLLFSTYNYWTEPLGGLIVGAVALTAMAVARQISAIRSGDRAHETIKSNEIRFQSLAQRSSDVITILNRDLSIQFTSPSINHVFGYSSDQLNGNKLIDLIHPEDQTRAIAFFTDLLRVPDSTANIEWRLLRADNSWRYVENICTNLMAEPTIEGIVLNSLDITKRKDAEDKLQHDAFHDSLTGLPNRSLFKEYLKTAISRSKRSKGHLYAVLFCDLDRFKNINDSLGHNVGDELLISIARRLEQSVRQNIDIVARLGGDEFAILLDGMAETNVAIHITRRIQESLRTAVDVGGHEIFATTSVGIALSSTGYSNPEDILRDADTAMYRAKARGRACYEIFDKFMHARAVALLQLENDLRRAIERKEFEVYYQPIVSLRDESKITGFEALVRWHHPERGLVSPADFISVAEDTGQIIHLGKWVLERACRQMRQWQDQHPAYRNLTLSVNLSGKQFLQPNLVEQIKSTLDQTGFDPHNLQLEITESVVIENTEIVTGMLMRLHELGIQLSMDDFGTGYSSLSYLHNFPIDVLKIDRSFIARKSGCEKNQIVSTIIALAMNMGLKVVAEGVETEEQLEHLKDMDCGYGQGFLFSYPMTAGETEALMGQIGVAQTSDQTETAA